MYKVNVRPFNDRHSVLWHVGVATGHRLSQGWPPHIGRPISCCRPSDDRSSYSTNFWPKTLRSDQSALISGRRLTAAKNCLWKRTFRNLNSVMYKIWFCGYRWLLLHNDFSILKTIIGEMIENFRRVGSGLNGVATHFNWRKFSWHFKQPLLFRSFPQKFICADLNILPRCIHTRYGCFLSLQMVVKIQCFVTSHRPQDGIIKNPTGKNNSR